MNYNELEITTNRIATTADCRHGFLSCGITAATLPRHENNETSPECFQSEVWVKTNDKHQFFSRGKGT